MEVAPGIYRIETPLGERFVCLFLLVGEERILLIDTGIDETPRSYLVPYLSRLGLSTEQIDYVLITHADLDHQGGNAALRELAPRATFACHELDRPLIESTERLIAERYSEFAADHRIDDTEETKAWYRAVTRTTWIDLGLQGGESLRLGTDWTVEILHLPGHSHGHLAVWDSRSRTAIIADAALQSAVRTKDGAPAFPPTYRYLEEYLATIQRLEGLPIGTLLTSHFPIYRGSQVSDFLTESRAFADRVDLALCDELRATPGRRTTRQLVASLAPQLGSWPASAGSFLVFPLMGHLERLQHQGRITTDREDGVVTWCWRG